MWKRELGDMLSKKLCTVQALPPVWTRSLLPIVLGFWFLTWFLYTTAIDCWIVSVWCLQTLLFWIWKSLKGRLQAGISQPIKLQLCFTNALRTDIEMVLILVEQSQLQGTNLFIRSLVILWSPKRNKQDPFHPFACYLRGQRKRQGF